MKRSIMFLIAASISIISFGNLSAQDKNLNAKEILEGIDNVINAPRDQTLEQKMILIDNSSNEKTRTLMVMQKGFDRRMAKFLSPQDQKGIAFLSLPNDVIYLYLPAFRKVRRIAAHVKNTKFAGTDFSYEDMEAKRYSEKWIPELLGSDGNHYTLKITPMDGVRTDYSKIILKTRKDNFYPERVELYNKGGRLFKVATTSNIRKYGKYWMAEETKVEDVISGHSTKIILIKAEFDKGLPDSQFSERYLSR